MTELGVVFVVGGLLGAIGTYLQFHVWQELYDDLDQQASRIPIVVRWLAPHRLWPKTLDGSMRIVVLGVGELLSCALVTIGLAMVIE